MAQKFLMGTGVALCILGLLDLFYLRSMLMYVWIPLGIGFVLVGPVCWEDDRAF